MVTVSELIWRPDDAKLNDKLKNVNEQLKKDAKKETFQLLSILTLIDNPLINQEYILIKKELECEFSRSQIGHYKLL